MDVDAKVAALEQQRKILTRIGIWGTALFGGMIGSYAYLKGGIVEMLALPLNNMGDFLAGAFAPLAFLWLVIGYRMQALELEQNSKEMKEAVEQATLQASAMNENKNFVRQDIINKTRSQFETKLGVMAVNFIQGGHIIEDNGIHSGQPTWSKFSAGDKEVFAKMAAKCADNFLSEFNYCYQNEIGTPKVYYDLGYSEQYLSHFDYFITALTSLGEETAVEMYKQRSFGQLYELLKHHELILQQVAD